MNSELHLYYFPQEEFQGWWSEMDPRLLVMLDVLRHKWNGPIWVSEAPGACGRVLGPEDESQHNVERWDMVRAVDVFPSGMTTYQKAFTMTVYAARLGFTGIGLYPEYKPSPGLHLDVRRDRWPGNAAKWAGIRDPEAPVGTPVDYVGLQQGLERLPAKS